MLKKTNQKRPAVHSLHNSGHPSTPAVRGTFLKPWHKPTLKSALWATGHRFWHLWRGDGGVLGLAAILLSPPEMV